MGAAITRESIVAAVRAAVEPHDWARAMWIGGSASFGRLDEWSDVDLGLAVVDGRVADGFAAVETALTSLAPIELSWRINPMTHPKPQTWYRLRGADPFLFVDVGVLPASTPPFDRFVDRRRHGEPQVVFDRDGFTADVPLDASQWREKLRARVATLKERFELTQVVPIKSARRGEIAEAIVCYQAFTLRPLIEMLRIRHDPWRHDFDVRYLRYDLPDDVRRRYEALWIVRDLDDLLAKRAVAEAWFGEVLAGLDVDAISLGDA
jgi:hypothetical protein